MTIKLANERRRQIDAGFDQAGRERHAAEVKFTSGLRQGGLLEDEHTPPQQLASRAAVGQRALDSSAKAYRNLKPEDRVRGGDKTNPVRGVYKDRRDAMEAANREAVKTQAALEAGDRHIGGATKRASQPPDRELPAGTRAARRAAFLDHLGKLLNRK